MSTVGPAPLKSSARRREERVLKLLLVLVVGGVAALLARVPAPPAEATDPGSPPAATIAAP